MDVTGSSHETYEKLVEQEDRLLQRLKVCELAQSAVIDLFYKSEETLNREAVEEILKAILTIGLRLQSKLLAFRLEKKTVAHQLKKHR